MPHRTLRPAIAALLLCAPLLAAAPASAAGQRSFPCLVALQKISSAQTSTVTLTVQCAQSRTVEVSIAADDKELARRTLALQAGVEQRVSLSLPRISRVCATLRTDGDTSVVCTPR
ncbi:hypothetical protein [Streptomyces anandii]|uniref:Uncharacterized protein n=1 Tax=Streptomyces anandii TaxID=285454 RepID=A0ABW6HAK1_9ACTN